MATRAEVLLNSTPVCGLHSDGYPEAVAPRLAKLSHHVITPEVIERILGDRARPVLKSGWSFDYSYNICANPGEEPTLVISRLGEQIWAGPLHAAIHYPA